MLTAEYAAPGGPLTLQWSVSGETCYHLLLDYYPGPTSSDYHVLRGGSRIYPGASARVSNRSSDSPYESWDGGRRFSVYPWYIFVGG